MAITRSTKELSTTAISCGDSFDVILTLGAEPDITSNPTDIVLILDRSGSMQQSLPALKNAANVFIDIIDEPPMALRTVKLAVEATSESSVSPIQRPRTRSSSLR